MPKRLNSPSLSLSGEPSLISRCLPLIVIVIATLIAYSPAMRAGFIWDDDDYITQNENLRSFNGLLRLWQPRTTHQYYPAVFTTFWIEHQLWGLNPAGYHIVNILLHAANALLVWRLCSVLRIPGAWAVAAVFALHPVHVESVAWITERKNVLSGLFYLGSALMYLRFDDAQGDEQPRDAAIGRWRWYLGSLLLFVLALLSKSVTCSLPVALILMMLWQRTPITKPRLLPLAPMFIVGLLLALHTADLETSNVGAAGPEFAFTFGQRFIMASQALLFYPSKLLAPWPLVFIYPRWTIDATSIFSYWPLAIALTMVAMAALAFARGWRGPLLAQLFFAATIFPALGFFNFYPMRFSFVADHFQYLASLGVMALAVGGVSRLISNQALAKIAITAVLLALASMTWLQTHNYRDEETLWTMTLFHNERAWIAHSNLGKILMDRGDLDEALPHFIKAAELNSTDDQMLINLASAWRSAARRADDQNDDVGAEALYRRSLQLPQPDFDTHMLLGRNLAKQHRPAEAVEQYQTFVSAKPDDAFARFMLSQALAAAGRFDEAMQQAIQAKTTAQGRGDARLVAEIENSLAAYRTKSAPARDH